MELQQTSYEIWEQKYQLKNEHGMPVEDDVHATNERVAFALARNEVGSDFWQAEFQWALENGATPAGRIMSNAGAEKYKPATSLINCTVSETIEDSMDGILGSVHQSGLTLKAGCGIGYEFSTLRPRNAYVGGAGANTSGPITFMDIFDKMCFTVSSAGGRRGAQMATFAIWHPDVEEFIKAKREDGRLRQFNLSLLIDDEFMEAVKEDKDYQLVFPVTERELALFNIPYEELIHKDLFWEEEYCQEQGYVVDSSGILCKVYKTLKAKDLWNTIMQSTYDFAEPGFLLIDQINKENNNSFCEVIRATNPCLHPDSLIETVDGRVRIADIKEPTMVYTSNADGSLGMRKASASWVSKKNATVMKITTRNGKAIKVTPEHKVLVQGGKGWVEAKELVEGDRIVQLCRARRGVAYSGVKLTTEDNRAYQMEHRFIAEAVHGRMGDSDDVHHIDGDTYNNHIGNLEILSHSDHSKHTATHDNPQTHQEKDDSGKWAATGVSDKVVVPMPLALRSNMKNSYGNVIVDIAKTYEVTDVYDMTVEDTHNFIANFMVVHNCGEQPLPPKGSCLLGSINLAKMVMNPFTSNAEFDWCKYKEVIRIFTRMLDNVVDMNGLPLKGQREAIEAKRRHGMGFLGLGSAMSLLGMEYGSEASVEFTEEVMKVMAIEGYKEGARLALEKGCAPILRDTTNFTSWVHSPYITRLREADEELDWLLNTHKCRFTHATSIAPTGTISLSLNNNASNGIEPSFAHHYIRNVIKEGKNVKVAVDVYSLEMLMFREKYGDVDVPTTFSTSETVTTKQHVDIQAAAQKWCDSSISKTINVPTDLPFDEFQDIYLYAYEKGLKGCTTFRYNPEAFQGVLVKEDDLANTEYKFTLKDGTTHIVKGNDTIEYKGESQSAANLFDAHKENFFGKF